MELQEHQLLPEELRDLAHEANLKSNDMARPQETRNFWAQESARLQTLAWHKTQACATQDKKPQKYPEE